MTPTTAGTLTDRERAALAAGQAYLYRGRIVPIISGGEETEEEKAARETAEAAAAAAAKDKTFTQADVDRIVQERVARAKATPPEDYEALKASAAELEQIKEANKSDLEKEKARADKAEAAAKAATEAAKETTLRSAIVAEAARKNIVDPDAALALLDRTTLTLDDSGAPTNLAEAMDSLLTAKPYLAGGGTRTPGAADQGARVGGGSGVEQLASTDGMSADQIAAALAEGRLDTYLSTPK
jgi:hypothetical protein